MIEASKLIKYYIFLILTSQYSRLLNFINKLINKKLINIAYTK